jgi:hypothetical protein
MNGSPAAQRARAAVWRLAMVVPLQGPAGLFGPSCEAVSVSPRARAIDGLVRIDRPEPAAQESEFTAI